MHNYRSASQSVRASLQDSYARQGSANYLRSSALPRGQIALTKNLQLLNLWPEGAYGGAIAAGSRHSRLLRAGTARGLLSQPPECEARSRREANFQQAQGCRETLPASGICSSLSICTDDPTTAPTTPRPLRALYAGDAYATESARHVDVENKGCLAKQDRSEAR